MKTYKIEVKETLSNVVELSAEPIDEAILKIRELHNGNINLINNDSIEIETNIDFHEIPKFEIDNDFTNYIYENAKKMLDILPVEDLSKFAFGSLTKAINSFKLEKQ